MHQTHGTETKSNEKELTLKNKNYE